jgi:hypothetical protein
VAVLENGSAEPYFTRRFHPQETREVRLYLHGGDDRVKVRGHANRDITIRVVAGTGRDRVDDEIGDGVARYDFPDQHAPPTLRDPSSEDGFESLFTSDTINMPGTDDQDWGKRSVPVIVFGYHRDPGFVLGGGYTWEIYRFRSPPWGQRHRLRGGVAFGPGFGMADYRGGFRWPQRTWYADLMVRASSLDQLRYYGLGNETSSDLPDSAYRIKERRVTLFPALARDIGRSGVLTLGPVFRYSDSRDTDADTVLGQQQPFGFGSFSEAGLRIGYAFDNRKPHRVLQPGVQWSADASLVPAVGDVNSTYGWVEANLGWHVDLSNTTLLSLYGGGKKIWGTYPYFEAAYLGGQGNALGYSWNRFAGDASVHGSAQIRWAFKKIRSWLPGELGFTAGLETGRVFVEGEDSHRWHNSAGIGFFFAPFDRWSMFEIGVTRGSEETFVILRSGVRLSGVR